MIEEIKLSEDYTIYKSKYQGLYSKEDFLAAVELNKRFASGTENNSVWIEVEDQRFQSINNLIRSSIESISSTKFKTSASHYWIYTQTEGFNIEWMHQHILVHPDSRSNIRTDYTFTFYIQTPKDISGDEGYIVFEDENKNRHKFLPNEGDIFIFPGDIRHTAIPTPKSKTDRIVYAGSICMDVLNQKDYKKTAI